MAMSGGKDDGSPMMEMNMTPLIDVMLVLLIMFIITIPVATHAVDIDLPVPNPESAAGHGRADQEQDRADAGQRDPVERRRRSPTATLVAQPADLADATRSSPSCSSSPSRRPATTCRPRCSTSSRRRA